ncbi:signal transducing adapter molecule 1 isoform X1 [Bactrocera neohumeralis]|uniref:signal transducing adapter molecule 1 isoform X1 n=1 Tax=Bactrocera tryoni TaxID=59916 RepID=UPI001A970D39|nr:signal transducing adapter molecule 1 isoform X1 [Bactrocera tryoni]XP_050318939.1 signal transducing adapter molecule 1 isoform X1 [Bactrocera neohumeralis]
MGIFTQSTPFDAEIEKATSETNTNENWSLILDVCDKVSSNPRSAKDCLKAIMKRMGHADPHVVMQALTLLDACVNNCGKPFHLEIASREFENEFRRLLSKAQPKISLKMRQVLKTWAEGDFKSDAELNLIPSLYMKLRQEGYDFSNLNEKPPKSAAKLTALKDPNVVSSQQEEDDIAKAIELSLKETKNSPKLQSSSNAGAAASASTNAASAYSSLYPSFSGSGSLASITSTGGASNNSTNSQPEPRKVRALYDFEAAEENELTFFSGEIIHVLDDSDPNWWKGYNQRGEGLFPSNFVTADLSVDPERLDINQQNKTKKSVQFEDDAKALQLKTEAAAAAVAEQRIEIDEEKIDRLLHLLHEANPEDPSQDSEEMLRLEQEVHQMGPLIDTELERVDRKHAQLTQLSSDLVDAINLYHSLMRDDRMTLARGPQAAASGYLGGMPPMGGAMPGLGYQGVPNPQMLYGAAGYPGNANFPPHMQQAAHMPTHNYGMQSLPYGNPAQLPGNVAPVNTQNSLNQNAVSTAAPVPGGTYSIPQQYQNGHVNASQLNGNVSGSLGLNSLPPSMSSLPYMGAAAQLPATSAPPASEHQQMPQSTMAAANAATVGVFNPVNQLQQLGNIQPLQSLPPMPQYPNGINDGVNAIPPDQLHQQQSFPHHLQQLPQHYGTLPTSQPPPNAFMTSPPTSATGMAPGMLPPSSHGMHNPTNGGDQFSQLQHQMAAISLAGGVNQPVTQNFLVQNDPKHNIPLYQQQR